jgi:hypothetical protein
LKIPDWNIGGLAVAWLKLLASFFNEIIVVKTE